MEVGVAYNVVRGDPSTPPACWPRWSNVDLQPHRARYYVRAWTPLAKIIQSMRGNGRVVPAATCEGLR